MVIPLLANHDFTSMLVLSAKGVTSPEKQRTTRCKYLLMTYLITKQEWNRTMNNAMIVQKPIKKHYYNKWNTKS